MATYSSILAWKTPWMEEPGRLQSMGSQRVGHDWTTAIPQARRLEWVAFPFFRGSSRPRNQTGVSWIISRFFTNWAIRGAHGEELLNVSVWKSRQMKMTQIKWPVSPVSVVQIMYHLKLHKLGILKEFAFSILGDQWERKWHGAGHTSTGEPASMF